LRSRVVFLLALLFVGASPGLAGTVFNFANTFPTDDFVQMFHYTVQNTAPVEIFTTSFATGGFAPVLSVFDNLGNLVSYNVGSQTNDCVNNAQDPATGACWDARLAGPLLAINSVAGTQYLITLTEDDNLPWGPTLADGFFEQGNGNFTAAGLFGPLVPGGSFLLASGAQRTGDWAVTIQSDEPTLVATIPEPSTAALFLTGAGLLAFWRRTKKNR
jgi:hypothetical protein